MSVLINFFRLQRLFYTRKFIKELMLTAEVYLMVVLLVMVLVPLSNYLLFSSEMDRCYPDHDRLIYYTKDAASDQGIKVSEIIDEIGEGTMVYYSEYETIPISQEKQANLIVMSDDMFSNVKISYANGQLKPDDSYIAVVVSPSMEKYCPVGRSFSTRWNDQMLMCYVTGVLSDEAVLMNIGKSTASFPQLEALGQPLATYDGSNYMFAITVENNKMKLSEQLDAAVIRVPDTVSIDQLLARLEEKYWDSGRFFTYRALKSNSLYDVKSQLKWQNIVAFLLGFVIVVNFFGYIMVSIYQKRHLITILNICGLSYHKTVALHLSSMALLVMAGVLAGLWNAPRVMHSLGISFYGFNRFYYITMLALFLIVTLLGVLAASFIRKSTSMIYQYKKS